MPRAPLAEKFHLGASLSLRENLDEEVFKSMSDKHLSGGDYEEQTQLWCTGADEVFSYSYVFL